MRPIHVVHMISAMPVGGVETNLLRILPRFDPRRFRLSLVVTRERGDLATPLEAAGVPVTLVYQRTRYDPLSLWRMRNHLRAVGATIVHAHMRRANTTAALATLLARTPVCIATEHDMALDKSWRHRLIDRILSFRFQVILGVTKAVCDLNARLTGIPREKYRVMYLGLDLDHLRSGPSKEEARQILGIPFRSPVVGFVGRLHAIKNVDQILRAFALPLLQNVTLVIVGDGPERASCEALVDALGLRSRVYFAGYKGEKDLPLVFASLDALVLASSSEGIATIQMEAMAAGVPVVSTVVGFVAEILRPGEEYIAIPSPTPEAIAQGIREVLNPGRAHALIHSAGRVIQQFSLERQVAFLESLYEELVAGVGCVSSSHNGMVQ